MDIKEARRLIKSTLPAAVFDHMWYQKTRDTQGVLPAIYYLLPESTHMGNEHNEAILAYIQETVEKNPENSYFYSIEQLPDCCFWGIHGSMDYVRLYFWTDFKETQ